MSNYYVFSRSVDIIRVENAAEVTENTKTKL